MSRCITEKYRLLSTPLKDTRYDPFGMVIGDPFICFSNLQSFRTATLNGLVCVSKEWLVSIWYSTRHIYNTYISAHILYTSYIYRYCLNHIIIYFNRTWYAPDKTISNLAALEKKKHCNLVIGYGTNQSYSIIDENTNCTHFWGVDHTYTVAF